MNVFKSFVYWSLFLLCTGLVTWFVFESLLLRLTLVFLFVLLAAIDVFRFSRGERSFLYSFWDRLKKIWDSITLLDI